MKEAILKLEEERKELIERIGKINNAINSFREVCNHKNSDGSSAMEYQGHDHKWDYFVCDVCGYKERK